MQVRCVAVIALLLAVGEKVNCIPLEDFYPFGREVDNINRPTLDGNSGEIDLSFTFPFFGINHTTVYVSNIY